MIKAKTIKRIRIALIILSVIFLVTFIWLMGTGYGGKRIALACFLLIMSVATMIVSFFVGELYSEAKEYEDLVEQARIKAIDEIDSKNTNENLLKKLSAIKKYYEEGAEIKEIRAEKNIEKLMDRRNYLDNRYYIADGYMSTIMGVIVSMLSSAAYEAIVKAIKISDENDTKKNWIVLVQGGSQILVTAVFAFGLVFLVSATYRIVANNKLKNIEREIRNYEIEYIDKNIKWIEQHLEEGQDDIEVFKRGIKNAISESDIDNVVKKYLYDKIDKMRLLLTDGKDNKNYYKEKVSVNGIKGYILHEKTIAQDQRLMDYKELEKILDKYDVELNVERNIDR